MISPEDVPGKIDEYLKTMPSKGSEVEIGFFGGTFTGLAREVQEGFLLSVRKYLSEQHISGIRLSTRPDRIDKDILRLLKKNGVRCIELGVQSMSDRVLSASKRGHTADDVRHASGMILDEGFILGHQIMLGLPFSTFDDEIFTAECVKELGASQVRIYPVVVMKNTLLAEKWIKKEYTPLSEEEAVERSARIVIYFESENIKVIRCGLHPSEDLLSGQGILAGPFHTAFGSKVESRIFSFILGHIVEKVPTGSVGNAKMFYNPRDEAVFFGFKKENLHYITDICGRSNLRKDKNVPQGSVRIVLEGKDFLIDRKTVADAYDNNIR